MKPHHMPDWESHLVIRAQAGERVAFELLADEHRGAMLHHAARLLRDADDAHDAVQDALVKAWRAIRSFQPGRPVLPWLLRIVSNCSVDALRARRHVPDRLEPYEYSLSDESRGVWESAEAKFEGDLVRAAVDRLPEPYRGIIHMRHFRSMEVTEIASALNRPEGTIKSWLFRARALLRKQLQVALG